MITTGKALALVALIAATGVGTVQMAQDSVQAAEAVTTTPIEAYAARRVDAVFDLVAAAPTAAPFMIPMASKGDLLVSPGARSASSTLIEYRGATSSTLLRLGAITIAVVKDEIPQRSD